MATLRWTRTSPGSRPMISFAGMRASEQPICDGASRQLRLRRVPQSWGRKKEEGGEGAGSHPEELGLLGAGHALEVLGVLGEGVVAKPGSKGRVSLRQRPGNAEISRVLPRRCKGGGRRRDVVGVMGCGSDGRCGCYGRGGGTGAGIGVPPRESWFLRNVGIAPQHWAEGG